VTDNPNGLNDRAAAGCFHREAQDKYFAEAIIASRLRLVGVTCRVEHGVTQNARVFERNAERGEEDSRLMLPFSMAGIQRVRRRPAIMN